MASRPYRQDIQGLRAIAVTLVVLAHAQAPIFGGFIGVDVFFVISGFVITRLLWDELASTGRLDLLQFYGRRIKRLLPALALMLAFVACGSLVLESALGSQQLTAKTGVAASLFVANAALFQLVGDYFATPAAANPLLHMWTLAVEEQFYLGLPFLLVLAWRLRRRGQDRAGLHYPAVLLLGLGLVVSFALCVYLTSAAGAPTGEQSRNNALAFYASPTRAWEFLAGALLAIAEPALSRGRAGAARIAGAAGLLLIAGAAFGFDETTLFPGVAALLPVAGASLVILGGMSGVTGVGRWLTTAPMVWIGARSYGWYLWHWPFIVFAQNLWPSGGRPWLLLAAAASLVPTTLSFRYVEEPVRRSVNGGRAVLRLGTVSLLVPVLLFGALSVSTRFPPSSVEDLRVQAAPHADDALGCAGNLPGSPQTDDVCSWRPSGSQGTVLLLGDSNAGHFTEPVVQAAGDLGLSTTLATASGCPFADVVTRREGLADDGSCSDFVERWTEEVVRSRPAAVVLASATTAYLREDDVSMGDPRTSLRTDTPSGKQAAWAAGLERTLARWSDAGVPAIVVHTVPHFPSTRPGVPAFDLRRCPTVSILLDSSSCGTSVSRRAAVEAGRAGREAEEAAARAAGGTTTLDLLGDVCDASTCATHRDEDWLYRDSAHLSLPFSLTLAGRFREALQQELGP